jgi:copper chaperone CopZ
MGLVALAVTGIRKCLLGVQGPKTVKVKVEKINVRGKKCV